MELDTNDILKELRENPTKVFTTLYILVDCHRTPGDSTEGGGCRCDEVEPIILDEKVYKITVYPNEDGKDYYYSWIQPEPGIGTVEVPDTAPEGTMVFTQTVQGCRFEDVARWRKNSVFICAR